MNTDATRAVVANATSATSQQEGRRTFLRRAGLSGAALALAGCTLVGAELFAPTEPSRAVVGTDGSITLDFSNDIDVLNYAYALEQREAAFYVSVVTNAQFTSIFSANEQRVLRDVRDVRDHEVVHKDFLAAALAAHPPRSRRSPPMRTGKADSQLS